MASIQKRVSKRTGKFTWRVDYKDAQGVRRAKSFDKKGDATDWKTKVENELKNGIHTPDSISPTFSDAAKLFLQRAERDNLENSTIRQYRSHLDIHLLPKLGGTKLSKITAPMLEVVFDNLEREGRSRAMVCKLLTTLRGVLSEAQRRGLIAHNAALVVKRRLTRRGNGSQVFPTKQELNAIITCAEGRWRPLFMTLIFTGIRSSELRGLTWQNVDIERGVLQINQRADKWNKLGPPKSAAGYRTVPLAPMLRAELESWRAKCPESAFDLVFPNGSGNVESLCNIHRRGFVPLLKRLGIINENGKHPFRMHDLRHAAASLLIEEGLSPKWIQTVLGHSSIQMTYDTYGHLWEDHETDQAAVAAIERNLLSLDRKENQ